MHSFLRDPISQVAGLRPSGPCSQYVESGDEPGQYIVSGRCEARSKTEQPTRGLPCGRLDSGYQRIPQFIHPIFGSPEPAKRIACRVRRGENRRDFLQVVRQVGRPEWHFLFLHRPAPSAEKGELHRPDLQNATLQPAARPQANRHVTE